MRICHTHRRRFVGRHSDQIGRSGDHQAHCHPSRPVPGPCCPYLYIYIYGSHLTNSHLFTALCESISALLLLLIGQLDCGMNTPVDAYLDGFHFGLVEVVYEWARGTPFCDITGALALVFDLRSSGVRES